MKINPLELFLNVHLMSALYTSFPARKAIHWHSHYEFSKGETHEKQIHFFFCTNICKIRVWLVFFLFLLGFWIFFFDILPISLALASLI